MQSVPITTNVVSSNHTQAGCTQSRLVIGTSRTVGSAKKFVRITSGFGGGEFTEDASQGMYMSKIEISFSTARILQNQ